jgi:hypothetical protein
VTGWHLLSGKELGGSDAKRIVTDDATPSGRQRTARRFAVVRGGRRGASNILAGLPARPAALSCPAAFPGRSRPPPVVGPDPVARNG